MLTLWCYIHQADSNKPGKEWGVLRGQSLYRRAFSASALPYKAVLHLITRGCTGIKSALGSIRKDHFSSWISSMWCLAWKRCQTDAHSHYRRPFPSYPPHLHKSMKSPCLWIIWPPHCVSSKGEKLLLRMNASKEYYYTSGSVVFIKKPSHWWENK